METLQPTNFSTRLRIRQRNYDLDNPNKVCEWTAFICEEEIKDLCTSFNKRFLKLRYADKPGGKVLVKYINNHNIVEIFFVK